MNTEPPAKMSRSWKLLFWSLAILFIIAVIAKVQS
ncbi:hypothetical protein SAMN05445060_2776 [Williamsia sterculiae]|uniref:Uncharacterized protein n=1 Tax=Williamsia sterculiae TaxID=1344003 RepID=A0A1N7GH15_9NOCA|nr:hypothetical protein SAMN05445060_2776 [Williamsia sterculiae]